MKPSTRPAGGALKCGLLLLTMLLCLATAVIPAAAGPEPVLVLVVLDGCPASALHNPGVGVLPVEIAGQTKTINTVFPSSTAASHAALLTGVGPDRNGVTGKEYLGSDHELHSFDQPALLESQTILQWAASLGYHTALVSGKSGVRSQFEAGCEVSVCPQKVPDWLQSDIGAPPDQDAQYDDFAGWYVRMDRWVMDAAIDVIQRKGAGQLLVINIPGIDKVGHRYGPVPAGETTEVTHQAVLDLSWLIDALKKAAPGRWGLFVTADHGMTEVSRAILPLDVLPGYQEVPYPVSFDGGTLGIWPPAGREQQVVNAVKALPGVAAVTGPGDMGRATLHATHPRSAPVLAIAASGWMFLANESFLDYTHGSHGTTLASDMEVPLMTGGPCTKDVDLSEVHSLLDLDGIIKRILAGE